MWTTGEGGDLSGLLNGLQSVQTDDFDVVGKRQRPVHVFLALIEQPHAVIGVKMTFFLGRRDQARCLGDRRSLSLQFQEPIFELVKALSKRLSLGFLFIPNRPGIDGVHDGQKADGESSAACNRIQRHRLRERENTG